MMPPDQGDPSAEDAPILWDDEDEPENEIMAELRQIRREMLAECGGDRDALFRAIRAKEAELVRRGFPVVSRPPRPAGENKPNAA
jgi:hypothetical protein